MTTYTTERVEWVDIYKGLAIIYVVLGHVSCFLSPIVYLFHMNAFFFISGYTTSLEKHKLPSFVANKVVQLVIPFITINIFFQFLVILLKYYGLLNLFYVWDLSYDSIFNRMPLVIFRGYIGIPELGGTLWFLLVLFFTAIISKILFDLSVRLRINILIALLFSFLLLLCGYFLYKNKIILPFWLDLCFTSIFYFQCGRVFLRKDIFNKFSPWYAVPIATFLLYYFTYINNMKMDWPNRGFKNPLLSIVASFAGIYITYFLSTYAAQLTFLKRTLGSVGRRTLQIMAMHFLAFKVIYLLLYFLGVISIIHLHDQIPPRGNHYWHILTALSILLIIYWDYILRYNPYLGYMILGGNREQISVKLKLLLNKYFSHELKD